MKRRGFLTYTSMLPLGFLSLSQFPSSLFQEYPASRISDFSKRLQPIGRILETEGYYVWGCSPIEGPDGKIHVFYSRWKDQKGMGGWINSSEIAHAVADSPESPFTYVETVFAPRPGHWDATTCHNPHIKLVDGKFCLFYMGNSDGRVDTKRIGLATADSPNGPWKRPDKPLLEANTKGTWDDFLTSNPTFLKHPNGEYWLYYKSWNKYDYYHYTNPKIRGNRKYGLAIADKLEGPYKRYAANPIIDFSGKGDNTQVEDGYVWMENGTFYMLARDMGVFDHQAGIIMESEDGIHWSEPKIAWFGVSHYIEQPPKPKHLSKYGRFERPQLLIQNGKPTYLFLTSQGGAYMTASPFVFKLT